MLFKKKAVGRTISTDLYKHENKISSQFGEDGVLAKLSSDLGIVRGTFFEFGISQSWQAKSADDLEGNFVDMRRRGWKGTFLDGQSLPPGAGVVQGFITALNINSKWRELQIPNDLDFMSIDVDGQDFWIWMALAHRPKTIIIEYNGIFSSDRSVTVQFDISQVWDGTVYHGASLLALDKLARSKDYTLVWANGINAIFVQDELCSNRHDFSFGEIHRRGTEGFEKVFQQYPPHKPDERNRPWIDV